MNTRKTTDLYTLQGNYGQGWEDLTSETSRAQIFLRRKEYRENEGGNYRIVKSRERKNIDPCGHAAKIAEQNSRMPEAIRNVLN